MWDIALPLSAAGFGGDLGFVMNTNSGSLSRYPLGGCSAPTLPLHYFGALWGLKGGAAALGTRDVHTLRGNPSACTSPWQPTLE